jgi:Domain of unknown function (DUF5664)
MLNQNEKTVSDEKLKVGDRVRHKKSGLTGVITSLPNSITACIKYDLSEKYCEYGEKLIDLEYEVEDSVKKECLRGEGGAPTRTTTLPDDPTDRKNYPIATGVLDYFPDALVAISKVSKAGNDQHNPGLPLRWTRSKSGDEADTCMRHFLQRGTLDSDGQRHTAKAAWRMLALLQKEIENE